MSVKCKIKKGDEVLIIAGKDKGLRGRVKQVFPLLSRVVVEGVNTATRNIRKNPTLGINESRQVKVEMPVHISNVALYNTATQKRDKIQIRSLEDGKKVRVYRSTQEQVDTQ